MARTMSSLPQVSRALRHPQHQFYLKQAPYEIQPFFIAPVLPGETMKSLSLQARAITRPIVNSLIGWWIEHYVFYVKHRDLNSPTTFTSMMIDSSAVITGHEDYYSARTDAFYGWTAATTGMDWLKACTRKVVETYFRDEGEAWDAVTIDGHPAAYLTGNTMFDSAILASSMSTATDVTIPVDATPTPDVVQASDVERALRTYQLLQDQNLINISYEDFLASYGVRQATAPVNRPELVRYMRQWSYPSAFVQPDAGGGDSDVTSAVSWNITERADKDRFFKEPGFLVGYCVVRPKVYLGKQMQPGCTLMKDAMSWLPAILRDDSNASWVKVTDGANDILAGFATGDWWLDIKDLLLYGDQFVNFAQYGGGVAANIMDNLPTTGLNARVPIQASVDALFVSADATAGILQDGVVRLSILGNQRETSPRGAIANLVA